LEKITTKFGLSVLEKPMTRGQATRYGDQNMPDDLRRAGFKTHIFRSDREIHGSDFYRIGYTK